MCRVLWASLMHEHPDIEDDYNGDNRGPACTVLLRARRGMLPRIWFSIGVRTIMLGLEARCAEAGGAASGSCWETGKAVRRFVPGCVERDLEGVVKDTIKPWLKSCRKHEECRRDEEDEDRARLPTRLVDVGTLGRHKVKLVEASDLFAKDYITLSYVGGDEVDPVKTTLANLDQRRRRIDMASLPKTIQDAILVTRALKVRYLWVPALCIIHAQPDEDLTDWRHEVARQGTYFSNALLLLSALSGTSASSGLLMERRTQRFSEQRCLLGKRACLHGAKDESSVEDSVWAQVPLESLSDKMETAPLMRRAWCLQEWVLAPRILHWSDEGVFWECRSVAGASERHPHDGGETPPPERRDMLRASAEQAICDFWPRVVTRYSRMQLSRPTDRLAAINGLASLLVECHPGMEYAAGVFRSDVANGLLWQRGRRDTSSQTKLPDVPSWSWASCSDGGVYVDSSGRHTLVRCIAFPPTQPLRIKAPLLEVEMEMQGGTLMSSAAAWPGAVFRLEYDFVEVVIEEAKVVLLVVVLSRDRGRQQYNGLMVRESEEGGYERVGVVNLTLRVPVMGSERDFDIWRTEIDLV